MRNTYKRIISLLTVLSLLLVLLSVPSLAAENPVEPEDTAAVEPTAENPVEPEDTAAADTPMVIAPSPMAFEDVPQDAWYYEFVEYAFQNSLFKGVSDTVFNPGGSMNRAMFVTVLYRQAQLEIPDIQVSAENPFTDISYSNPEFQTAIRWAAQNGIVNGKTATTFAPGESVTRQQMCAIIVRYLRDYRHYNLNAYTTATSFADSDMISVYAREAVIICRNLGIIEGTTLADGTVVFTPHGTATRAAVAKVITNTSRTIERLNVPMTPPEETEDPTPYTPPAVDPANPNPPAEPETPANPENPQTPANPENPETPANPETPVNPTDPSNGTAAALAQAAAVEKAFKEEAIAAGKSEAEAESEWQARKAEEERVVESFSKITDAYNPDEIDGTLGGGTVKESVGLLMDTLTKAVDDAQEGYFVDRDYVLDHYTDEVAEFIDQYSSMDEESQGQTRRILLDLADDTAGIIASFFGVDTNGF